MNPFAQPDYTKETEPPMKIAVPKVLSFLATRDFNGYVPGIRNIINGYTKDDGTVELPLKEKIIRGKQAIEALKAYRGGQKTDANIKDFER